MLYGKLATYDHLYIFYCYFPYLRPFNNHKLEFRSQPYTFLGYSPQHKGYYCLTLEGKVVILRHVVFDETQFLFYKKVPSDFKHDTITTFVTVVKRQETSSGVRQSSVLRGDANSVSTQLRTDSMSKSSSISNVLSVPSGNREDSGHSFTLEVSILEEPAQLNVNTHHMVT